MPRRRLRFDFGLLAAAILPIIAILPTLSGNFVIETADGFFHVHRIFAVTTLIQSGDLYPRWIPWFHLGYGYPVLNYYAPLGTYLGGLLGVFGVTAPIAYSLIITAGWIGGSVGMYVLARRFMPAACAILASALWAYAPSYFQNVWNVGSISQLTASAIAPWLILSLAIGAKSPGLRPTGFIALAFGGVLLAHQPTAVLSGLLVLPAAIIGCVWYSRENWRSLARRAACVGSGVALGIGVAGIFLLPMALGLNYIQISETGGDIPHTLAANFLRLTQIFQPIATPDQSQLQPSIAGSIGLVGGIFAAFGFVALLMRRRYFLALMLGVGALFAVFLLLDASMSVWLNVPFMAQLRFPGRALRLGSIIFALLGGASLWLLPRRWQTYGSLVAVALVVLATLPLVYPSRDLIDFSNLNAANEIQYEADTYAFGGTSYNEFKPIWGNNTPFDVPANFEDYATNPLQLRAQPVDSNIATVEQLNDTSWRVHASQPFPFALHQFYFPGWSVEIDGAAVIPYSETTYGLLSVDVPQGDHVISVRYTGTTIEQVAPFITLVSLVVVGILIVRGQPIRQEPPQQFDRRAALILTAGVILFAVVNELFIQPNTNWFRQRSPIDSPVAMVTPVHENFGDAYELLGYTLHQTEVVPGDNLEITLFWKAQQSLTATYEPVIQIVDPLATRAWGAAELPFVGGTPDLHQPDYFIVHDIGIPIFEDAPPYIGSVSVQLRDPQTGNWLLTSSGSNRLILPDTIRIIGDGQPSQRVFHYVLNQSIELWCVSIERSGNTILVDLFWHVLNPLTRDDVRVFVHGLDDNRNVGTQADGPPLNGEYLPTNWLPGQNLHDHFTLADTRGEIQSVNVGMYVPNGARFEVYSASLGITDDTIRLNIAARDCRT